MTQQELKIANEKLDRIQSLEEQIKLLSRGLPNSWYHTKFGFFLARVFHVGFELFTLRDDCPSSSEIYLSEEDIQSLIAIRKEQIFELQKELENMGFRIE